MASEAKINTVVQPTTNADLAIAATHHPLPLLPMELIGMIVGCLADCHRSANQDLISCSVVSRVWRAVSLKFLFRDVDWRIYDPLPQLHEEECENKPKNDLKNEDDLEDENDPKDVDDSNDEDEPKVEDDQKNKDDSKNEDGQKAEGDNDREDEEATETPGIFARPPRLTLLHISKFLASQPRIAFYIKSLTLQVLPEDDPKPFYSIFERPIIYLPDVSEVLDVLHSLPCLRSLVLNNCVFSASSSACKA